jgi:hypothetical protein
MWFKQREGGTYYKWLVANRLGKLAQRMLIQQEGGRPRSVFAPLTSADWQTEPDLQAYLETGLHGSFADYPARTVLFRPSPRTPLDLDAGLVVRFLESKMEIHRDGNF